MQRRVKRGTRLVLYRHSEVFRSLLAAADLTLVGAAWVASYFVRFYGPFEVPLGVPDIELYLQPLIVILPLWFLLFRARGLYAPQRTGSLLIEGIGRAHA